VSFKSFLKEEIEVKSPKPNKVKFKVNLREYQEVVSKSSIAQSRKLIMHRVNVVGGDIPVFCEEVGKFFVVDTTDKKLRAREARTRDEKELCGTLLNGMMIKEHVAENTENLKHLLEMKVGWEIPSTVYTYKNEFGKNISIK
jgi:hypothetical protein